MEEVGVEAEASAVAGDGVGSGWEGLMPLRKLVFVLIAKQLCLTNGDCPAFRQDALIAVLL